MKTTEVIGGILFLVGVVIYILYLVDVFESFWWWVASWAICGLGGLIYWGSEDNS